MGLGVTGVLHLGKTGSLWPTARDPFHITLLFYTVSPFPFLTPTGLVRLLFIPFFSLINLKVPYLYHSLMFTFSYLQ